MRHRNKATAVLLTILLVLLIPLAWQRHRIDVGSPDVAVFVEGNELLLRSSLRGISTDSYLESLAQIGVTALAVPVTTLDDLQQRGKVAILAGSDAVAFYAEGEALPEPYTSIIVCLWPEAIPLVTQSLDTARINYSQVPGGNAFLVQSGVTPILRSSIGFDQSLIQAAREHGLDLILVFWPFVGSTVEFVVEQIRDNNPAGIVFTGTRIADLQENLEPLASLIRDLKVPIYRIQNQITLRGYAITRGMESIIGPETRVIRTARFSRAETQNNRLVPEFLTEKWIVYVREYNVRGLYVNPLFTDDDIGANEAYFRGIVTGLTSRGYNVGSVGSVYPRWYPSRLLQSAIGLLLSLVILTLIPSRRLSVRSVYLALAITLFVLSLTPLRALVTTLWATGLAVMSSFVFLSALRTTNRAIWAYIGIIALTLVAALSINLMMSDYDALMEYTYFRGVKIQYVLPLLMMSVLLWRDQLNIASLRRLLKVRLSLPQVVAAMLGIGFLGLYLVRSGNVDVIPAFEAYVRQLLDTLLSVRPRFKELVGNALLVFALFERKRLGRHIHSLILLMGTVATISIVNSFMHFRTPIGLTILRVFHAAWIGLVAGLAMLLLARVVFAGARKLAPIWDAFSGGWLEEK